MQRNILLLPDIHWGVIDPDDQWKALQFITESIQYMIMKGVYIDLIVIAGDYFDSKLPLNSREAIKAIQWFHELYSICYRENIQLRLLQGTFEHDNDQLQAFMPMTKIPELNESTGDWEDTSDFFKIFTTTTSEETLPGLHCIYCPDETLQTDDYEETYLNEILKIHDIGFFHGAFDVVYGSLLESNQSLREKKNVIFNYKLWDHVIRGPLLAGHWHDGKQWGHLYYGGSPFRFKFDEDEEKGILFVSYDTETHDYFVDKIKNPFPSEYVTFETYSNVCTKKDALTHLIDQVEQCYAQMQKPPLCYTKNRIRIVFHIVDDNPNNDITIASLRAQFINRKDIKLVIKNKLKKKRKTEEKKKIETIEKTYSFIHEKDSYPETIRKFIEEEYHENVPLEFIQQKFHEHIKKEMR